MTKQEKTVTVTISKTQLERILGKAEYVDADVLRMSIEDDDQIDWIQMFAKEPLTVYIWGYLQDLEKSQENQRVLLCLNEKLCMRLSQREEVAE